MVDFIMVGMDKFPETQAVSSHTMRDTDFLEGWVTYDTLCTYQVASNSGGGALTFDLPSYKERANLRIHRVKDYSFTSLIRLKCLIFSPPSF